MAIPIINVGNRSIPVPGVRGSMADPVNSFLGSLAQKRQAQNQALMNAAKMYTQQQQFDKTFALDQEKANAYMENMRNAMEIARAKEGRDSDKYNTEKAVASILPNVEDPGMMKNVSVTNTMTPEAIGARAANLVTPRTVAPDMTNPDNVALFAQGENTANAIPGFLLGSRGDRSAIRLEPEGAIPSYKVKDQKATIANAEPIGDMLAKYAKDTAKYQNLFEPTLAPGNMDAKTAKGILKSAGIPTSKTTTAKIMKSYKEYDNQLRKNINSAVDSMYPNMSKEEKARIAGLAYTQNKDRLNDFMDMWKTKYKEDRADTRERSRAEATLENELKKMKMKAAADTATTEMKALTSWLQGKLESLRAEREHLYKMAEKDELDPGELRKKTDLLNKRIEDLYVKYQTNKDTNKNLVSGNSL
jgi:hypothetical protein